jgi:hypothetical protein
MYFFNSFGAQAGVLSPLMNPILHGGPVWPIRPCWYCVTNDSKTTIFSHGLSDPFSAAEEPNIGLGIEIAVASEEQFGANWASSWLAEMAAEISNLAAQDKRFLLRFQKFGIFLMGFRTEWKEFDHLLDSEGYVGTLLGLPLQNSAEIPLPTGTAIVITAKLLTKQEYEYVAKNGLDGAQALAKLFKESGDDWLSSLNRASVV